MDAAREEESECNEGLYVTILKHYAPEHRAYSVSWEYGIVPWNQMREEQSARWMLLHRATHASS